MAATSTMPRAKTAGAQSAATDPDLRKRLKPLFSPPRDPVMVDVPELGYLMIDGHGAPEETASEATTEFQQSFTALYPVVYTLHFRLKREGLELPILPLEALWFTGEAESFDMNVSPDKWGWRTMIVVSDGVTPAVFEEAVAEVRRKKGDSEALSGLRFERWREGRSAQIMHVGPYSEERPTIERLHAFIEAQGCRPRGAHHEIYLGDPRKGDPAKLKTVLRQPVDE
jgi:hypothetical protein